MLTHLTIENFVLIDHVDIDFHKNLSVITGETGAGKSVILSALSFLLGEKFDATVVRNSASKASVKATFDIRFLALLDEAGIEQVEGEELLISRELAESGKSRVFINNQPVSISLVKKLAPLLIEFSGQHAHLKLLEEGAPLLLLDSYSEAEELKKVFKSAWDDENSIKQEIQRIESSESERLRLIDTLQREIEEISSCKLKACEDESLFAEFQILSNQEEIRNKVHDILLTLDESKMSVIPQLIRQKANFTNLKEIDPAFTEIEKTFLSAFAELQEISYEIKRYQTKLEAHPERLSLIEDRLKQIARLKKKYGQTVEDIESYRLQQTQKLGQLENEASRLDDLKSRLQIARETSRKLAEELSSKRTHFAHKLSQAVTKEIQTLNMAKAKFEIAVSKTHRTTTGDDKVEFFLTPNLGEKCINIQEAASGGELARISLALQVAMIASYQTPTIVFDEIDANIGGTTATIIGEKLAFLGQSIQVLSITHFPQVALAANAHFVIRKSEDKGRTRSTVEKLTSEKEKHTELTRMLGGKEIFKPDQAEKKKAHDSYISTSLA